MQRYLNLLFTVLVSLAPFSGHCLQAVTVPDASGIELGNVRALDANATTIVQELPSTASAGETDLVVLTITPGTTEVATSTVIATTTADVNDTDPYSKVSITDDGSRIFFQLRHPTSSTAQISLSGSSAVSADVEAFVGEHTLYVVNKNGSGLTRLGGVNSAFHTFTGDRVILSEGTSSVSIHNIDLTTSLVTDMSDSLHAAMLGQELGNLTGGDSSLGRISYLLFSAGEDRIWVTELDENTVEQNVFWPWSGGTPDHFILSQNLNALVSQDNSANSFISVQDLTLNASDSTLNQIFQVGPTVDGMDLFGVTQDGQIIATTSTLNYSNAATPTGDGTQYVYLIDDNGNINSQVTNDAAAITSKAMSASTSLIAFSTTFDYSTSTDSGTPQIWVEVTGFTGASGGGAFSGEPIPGAINSNAIGSSGVSLIFLTILTLLGATRKRRLIAG